MALRTILEYPDPRLRTRAQPVTRFDAALGTLIDDMFETMYGAPGIGLAATQVDVHQRLIVIDISPERNQPLTIINPQILAREGGTDVARRLCRHAGIRAARPRGAARAASRHRGADAARPAERSRPQDRAGSGEACRARPRPAGRPARDARERGSPCAA